MGGYVAWDAGTAADGSDSRARLVAAQSHWPEMRALILVVSAAKKDVSSTSGMQTTVATSSLFPHRSTVVVPQRMKEMEEAIAKRDFDAFGLITMKESNSFHATCLDTSPPIFYLNDISRSAIRLVESLNASQGRVVAAYTFDAGPNAVIYFLEENRDVVLRDFKTVLGDKDGWGEERGKEGAGGVEGKDWDVLREGVSRVILTGVGEGPVSVQEHLVDEKGEPVVK